MWEIYEHRNLTKSLNRLPLEILKRYEKWKDVVRLSGPTGLLVIRGFLDEALAGNWKGFRSSRLGQQYRVIYKIEALDVQVFVMDLTAHDYRRK
jgi:addiction module RelE/StbE family toxin